MLAIQLDFFPLTYVRVDHACCCQWIVEELSFGFLSKIDLHSSIDHIDAGALEPVWLDHLMHLVVVGPAMTHVLGYTVAELVLIGSQQILSGLGVAVEVECGAGFLTVELIQSVLMRYN